MFCLDELDNAVAGILMMSLYAMTGLAPVEVVFSPWTTPIPWFILGTLLLVTILEDTSILKRIACKCIILPEAPTPALCGALPHCGHFHRHRSGHMDLPAVAALCVRSSRTWA